MAAADYVAHGINAGVNRFADAMEKRKEEEKRDAKEFNALVSFAEASGLLTKEQAVVMDRDSLKGFVRGKMAKEEMDQQQARSAMAQFAQMQKMQEAEAMTSFAGDYTDFNDAYGDTLGAFSYGVRNNPQVDPQALSAFMGSVDKATPESAKPSILEKDLNMLANRFGVPEDELKKLAVGNLAQRSTGKRTTVRVGPDGTIELSEGTGDSPTIGTQGKIEQDVRNTRKSLDLIDDLVNDLSWKDVGVAGVFGENVMDKLLPQVGINVMNAKRVDNRTKLKMLIQGALRQISPDNRFTNEDRKRIEAMMPSTGIFENEQHAKEVLSTIQRVFAKRNVQDMLTMGKEIKPEELTNAEIGAAVEEGLISYEEAVAILKARP